MKDTNLSDWLGYARRVQAIAQNGLTYATGMYDRERYEELREISIALLSKMLDQPLPQEQIKTAFAFETGYQTPKVDIRGVVFNPQGEILMIREQQDGKWALPGGWADVNYSPKEIARKEVWEEAGIVVEPVRLLAVFDKLKHPHPPDIYHAYKLFILCDWVGGQPKTGMETLDVGFFAENSLPELSEERNTAGQIGMMFEYRSHPEKPLYLD